MAISKSWLLPLGLFFLFIALSPGRIIAFDVAVRAAVARGLYTEGSVFTTTPDLQAGLVKVPGHPGGTSFYGMGQSLAFIPFLFLGDILKQLGGPQEARRYLDTLPLVFLYVPLMGLLWWGALVRFLRWLRVEDAPRSATVFFLGTIVLVYASQTAQEESLVGALVLAALTAWGRALEGKPRVAFAAGFFAAAALLVRFNTVFLALPLLGVLLDHLRTRGWPRKPLALALAGAAFPLGLIGIFAHARYGNFLSTGYSTAAPQGLGVFWTRFQPEVFWGALVGPGKGHLFFSPLLLLAAWGWRAAWQTRRFLGISILTGFFANVFLCAFIQNNPDGSECWGTRYQVHWLPLFAPAVLEGWRRLLHRSRAVAAALLAAGISLAWIAAYAPDAIEYIQSDQRGFARTEMMTSATHGQLPQRLINIARRLRGQALEPTTPLIETMLHDYTPNVWGFSWALKLRSWLPLLVWTVTLAVATGLLVAGLLRKPPRC